MLNGYLFIINLPWWNILLALFSPLGNECAWKIGSFHGCDNKAKCAALNPENNYIYKVECMQHAERCLKGIAFMVDKLCWRTFVFKRRKNACALHDSNLSSENISHFVFKQNIVLRNIWL